MNPQRETGLEKLAGMLEARLRNTCPFVYAAGVLSDGVHVYENVVDVALVYGGGELFQFQMSREAAALLRDKLITLDI